MNWLAYLGVVVFVLGLSLVYGGLREWMKRRAVLRHPVKRKAKILQLEPTENADGDFHDWYVPIVSYSDDHGRSYTARLPPICNKSEYPVGKSIGVLYQRDQPANIIEQNKGVTNSLSISCGVGLWHILGAVGRPVDRRFHTI